MSNIVYIIDTQAYIEGLIETTRELYIAAFEAKYPNERHRMQEDYTDRMTGVIKDTIIQLSVTGSDHTDRFDDYIAHPDYPATNKCLLSYDESKTKIELNKACFYDSLRRAYGKPKYTKAEAETQGFFSVITFE